MKITVDRTKCEGYAKCVQVSPKVFQLDKTMIAVGHRRQGRQR